MQREWVWRRARNSYYSEENIHKTIAWAFDSFPAFHVFLGDELSYNNLLSLGYPPTKAKYKTGHQDRLLLNRVLRVFEELGIAEDRIVKYAHLKTDPRYIQLFEHYQGLLSQDEVFKGHLYQIIANLQFYQNKKVIDRELALKYFFAEIPLLLNSASLLGVESSCFVYHKNNAFLSYIFTEQKLRQPNQGFVAVSFE